MPLIERDSETQAARARRIVAFALIDGAILLLVVVPVLLWLFADGSGLSDDQMLLYAGGLIAAHGAVTVLLLWALRILPGRRA